MDTQTGTSSGTVPNSGSGSSTNPSSDAFISSLQDKLFQSSGVASSQGSNIDNLITGSINDLTAANTSNRQGIEADYTRQKNDASQTGQSNMTSEMEARRGMATNTGIIQNIQDNTNKQLTQLDLAEKSAVTKGDMDTASKIADLRVQQLTFQQQATQTAFQNQLSIYSAINTAKTTADNEQKQSFDEQSSMSSIALQFGIKLQPGDTLQSVVSRAAPIASQAQQADMALKIAQAHQANAEAQKALAGGAFTLDDTTAGAFASTYSNLVQTTGGINSPQAQNFISTITSQAGAKGLQTLQSAIQKQTNAQFDPNTMGQWLDQQFSGGANAADLSSTIANNPFATSDQKKTALNELIDAQNRFNQKSGSGSGAKSIFDTIFPGQTIIK